MEIGDLVYLKLGYYFGTSDSSKRIFKITNIHRNSNFIEIENIVDGKVHICVIVAVCRPNAQQIAEAITQKIIS